MQCNEKDQLIERKNGIQPEVKQLYRQEDFEQFPQNISTFSKMYSFEYNYYKAALKKLKLWYFDCLSKTLKYQLRWKFNIYVQDKMTNLQT